MPRTGGDQTREEIVRHAAELFRRRGYYKAGVRSILKAAGISRGAFYFHFHSKRELGEAVVAYYGRTLKTQFEQILQGRSWEDAMVRYVREFMGTPENPVVVAAPMAHLGIEFAGNDRRLLALVAEVMSRAEERVALALAKEGFPEGLDRRRAATVVACIEGHILRNVLYRDPRCISQATSHLIALGKPPAGPPSAHASERLDRVGDDAWRRVEDFAKMHLDSVDNRSIIVSEGNGADEYAQRREELLTGASALFVKRGYHATGIADVARAASIPKGSFHYYFENKQALALEVLKRLRAKIDAGMEAAFSAGDWQSAVKAFCRLLELFAGASALDAFPMARMGLEFAGSDERLAAGVAEMLSGAEKAFAAALGRYFGDLGDLQDRAAMAVALWQGHLARMAIYGDREILRQLCEDLSDMVA